jgi:hypothetical protein
MDELKDFRNFVFMQWQTLGLPNPAPIQYDVAEFIQTGPSRRMIQAMRGFGKSYMTAGYAAWRLMHNPDMTIMCLSAVQNRAREFIRLTRRLVEEMECLRSLKPGMWDRDGADRFDVGCRTVTSKDPSVAAYGIKAMVTGAHVDLIICDDVEIIENSGTIEARDTLYNKLMELENVLNPGGEIVYLGTPQTEESVYNKLAKHYECRRWPARVPSPDNELAHRYLAPYVHDLMNVGSVNLPTYPEYYPEEILAEREAIMGPSMFALQMLLDTTLADQDRYPLKLSDLVVTDCIGHMGPRQVMWGTQTPLQIESPGLGRDRFYGPAWLDKEWADFEDTVMYVDPSGRGTDETGYAVARLLNGTIFIPETGGLQGGHEPDVLKRLAEVAAKHGVRRIVCESNFGDGMFTKLLQPVVAQTCTMGVAVEEVRSTGQKERRILEILEPVMANHRLVVDPKVANDTTLMHQLTRLTRERGALAHDDRIEALSGAVGLFRDQLQVDPESRKKRQDQVELEKMVKEWDREASGKQKSGRLIFPVTAGIVPRARGGLLGRSSGWGVPRPPRDPQGRPRRFGGL